MRRLWTRDFLIRRIDRCYLIAALAKRPEKRSLHLNLARSYRRMLATLADCGQVGRTA
ncbi:MAG: hypothetical protein ABW184_09715 [Sphingobium sp.]